MACSNCFNGCVDIISDQCVRYTGLDVPALGILTGDPLSRVEESLTTFLVSALDGTGIKPYVNPEIICALVEANLPACGELTIVDLITGLIKSVCDLQAQINIIIVDVAAINTTLATLNSTYTTSCLTGTIDAESTHSVLQALITNFCALVASLPNTYVALADINQIIADWVVTYNSNTLISSKMVPWVAVPFFDPDISGKFDSTGKGLPSTIWKDIYLCNGNNPGVPDLRGVVPIGRTDMGSNAFNARVNPSIPGNPTYNSFGISGDNTITLSPAQMPTHTHTSVTTATQSAHFHYEFNIDNDGPYITNTTYPTQGNSTDGNLGYSIVGTSTVSTLGKTSSEAPIITAGTVNASAGSSEAHSNIQPVIACYYIIYIP